MSTTIANLYFTRVIAERFTPRLDNGNPIPNETAHVTRDDKIFIGFLHAVFSIVIAFFWHRFRAFPDQFDHISMFLLFSFSVLLILSLFSNYTNLI
jgi:hypothetical protein